MQTKWKPQTTHTCTQKLIEARADTNTDAHMQTLKYKNI